MVNLLSRNLRTCASAAVLLVLVPMVATEATNRPNILIYMADDFGYGSVGVYGANPALVRTPGIDRLAGTGLRFTQGYATASVCSPTRYAMMTGRYSWRSKLQYGVVGNFDPLLIEADVKTLPAWLREQGYQTAHLGKWHLGYKSERSENLLGKLSPGPFEVGFDYHFGVPNNMDDQHKVYVENDRVYGLRSDRMSPYGKSYYGRVYLGYDAPQREEPEIMENLTQRAIRWIDSRDREKPFFLFFAAVAVHHPHMASPRMVGTSEAGAYGDFIHDLDHSVGQLVEALEHRGLCENTLIIFVSDNGGDIPTDPLSPELQAVAKGLAINGNLRGDKHTIYEGGLRTPMIVSWPRVVKAGAVTEAFVTTADLFATVSDLLTGGAPLAGASPDGFSFARVLRDPTARSARPHGVFRDVDGRKAVRFGDWKYIDNYSPAKKAVQGEIELYNLAQDPQETQNLAERYKDRVEEGKALLERALAGS